ncbi:hypothetical protein GGF46_003752 [Coemansia sp. RSA 552]|nr:hypothetical protein GGF46_003752 [Coemansia sp. RSA 552]
MQLHIALFLAVATLAQAWVVVRTPGSGTVWPADNTPVVVSWASSSDTPETGLLFVSLMVGADPTNRKDLFEIASIRDKPTATLSFTPPVDLPGRTDYVVRVASIEFGVNYSAPFQAGYFPPPMTFGEQLAERQTPFVLVVVVVALLGVYVFRRRSVV